MSKSRKPYSYENLLKLFKEVEPLLDDVEANKVEIGRLLVQVPLWEEFLARPINKGWRKHYDLLANAVAKGRRQAKGHLERLRRSVRETANDNPFEVGIRVFVERYEHGWRVGYGKVRDRNRGEDGVWTYTVVLEETGSPIHIDHTRDLRPA